MTPILGIDLGTTYSTVSYLEDGKVITIDLESADDNKTLPSVVYYPEAGAPIVGTTACRQAKLSPDRVVSLIKRQMGEGNYRHSGTGKSPVDVSADILRTLVEEARGATGHDFKRAVITVPAYFGELQRADTRAAGERAGLEVLGLMPEPHAAALAYSVEHALQMDDRHLLVFDLGGGTFDVTLIHARSKSGPAGIELSPQTLEKDGDSLLGGADWDRVLFNLVGGQLQAQHGITNITPQLEASLLESCEKAKRDLSRVQTSLINGERPTQQVEITRAAFEKASRDLTFRTQQCLQAVLYKAQRQHKIELSKLRVLLCGGSTRMPMIREMIREVTGADPLSYKNPELLVSIGAAYWTALSQGDSVHPSPGTTVSMPKGALTDTNAFAIGVGLKDGQTGEYFNRIVIPPNAPYDGQRYDVRTTTTADDQDVIVYSVYEGESRLPNECRKVGEFEIIGLPKKPRGAVTVVVKLGFDRDGVISGYALHEETGIRKDVSVTRDGRGGAVLLRE